MREYVGYEFADLKSTLPFPFDLEKIIDDWVLMGFLVGNDFIPHLPHFHINKEALPILYKTYKEVLPNLDGYLNNGGHLHLGRFEKFMEKLADVDVEMFHEINADLKYFNSKRLGNGKAFKANKGGASSLELEPFDFGDDGDDNAIDVLKTFEKLGIQPEAEYFEDENGDGSTSQANGNCSDIFEEEFRQHKKEYYMTKMHYRHVDADVLFEQATCYVRGIQWILNYYYNGICSWSWFYPHHYSPYVSDIKGFSHLKLEYDMGRPFMPYEQLLAVLPPLSKKHLPEAYQDLMTRYNSPLKEYYPETFETDLNGKQQVSSMHCLCMQYMYVCVCVCVCMYVCMYISDVGSITGFPLLLLSFFFFYYITITMKFSSYLLYYYYYYLGIYYYYYYCICNY